MATTFVLTPNSGVWSLLRLELQVEVTFTFGKQASNVSVGKTDPFLLSLQSGAYRRESVEIEPEMPRRLDGYETPCRVLLRRNWLLKESRYA